MTQQELADLIFPEVNKTIEDLEREYPLRDLPIGAEVTRFAPSPTGFLHTGSLFTALIAQKFATQSKGVFFVRLEDTDSKREVSGSGQELLDQLSVFNVVPDEGYYGETEKGKYGPYKQSERADIYKIVIKELIRQNRAYPCFCSHEELDVLRKSQEAQKIIPGYYQNYARCRFLSLEQQAAMIKEGKPYVIRFRSLGNHENKIEVFDQVRGTLEIAQNDQDIVIFKSDGLPTYHFAHLVDDHFMRTTLVTRGEEWLASLPIHLELFASLNWQAPKYAHLPVIMKLDNGNKRKLSKRKDDEAAISFFLKDGYPIEAIKEYLFTIANSNYEEWHEANKGLSYEDFTLTFEKMSLDGALFDFGKLNFISKEVLASFSAEKMLKETLKYSEKYNPALKEVIDLDHQYFKEIMNIEKDKDKPRKDYEKYSEIFDKIKFFYDPYYNQLMEQELPFNPNIDKSEIRAVLEEFRDTLDYSGSEQEWFEGLKALAQRRGFAVNNKEYKKDPDSYKGVVGDIAEMVRICLTSSRQSPNLFYILKILKSERVISRINKTLDILS